MNKPEPQASERPRKVYVRPQLIAYGNVREFTRAGAGSKNEKAGGFFKSA